MFGVNCVILEFYQNAGMLKIERSGMFSSVDRAHACRDGQTEQYCYARSYITESENISCEATVLLAKLTTVKYMTS